MDGDSCCPASPTRTAPRPPATAHPGPCVHPPVPLIPLRFLPSAPSPRTHFPNSRASAASSSNSSHPPRPPAPRPVPAMGKTAIARTHAPSRAGRGEEQLAGPSSCEVWGCQGEEPGLRGRHGKAVRECYPEPLLPAALFCSLSGFLASEGPWGEADGAPSRDGHVLLATGSGRNVHLPWPSTVPWGPRTSSPNRDACSLGPRTGPGRAPRAQRAGCTQGPARPRLRGREGARVQAAGSKGAVGSPATRVQGRRTAVAAWPRGTGPQTGAAPR